MLSELDIYSVVGANKALQLVDARVSVGGDGAIVIRFEGVNGSPIVSGICIKQSADFPGIFIFPSLVIYLCENYINKT